MSRTIAWFLLGLVSGLLAGCEAGPKPNESRKADDPIVAELRQTVLPSLMQFVENEFVPGATLSFGTTQLWFAPGTSDFSMMRGYLVHVSGMPPRTSRRSIGTFDLQFFAHDASGKPKSFELAFELAPEFVPDARLGSWRPLFDQARKSGWIKTTWKGMEFEALDCKDEGMQVVLRSAWPMPYWTPSHQASKWFSNEDHLKRKSHVRMGAWLLSRLIPGAGAGHDPTYVREGSWLILPDRRAVYVRASEGLSGCSADIMSFDSELDAKMVLQLAEPNVRKVEKLGVQIKYESLMWPPDLDIEEFMTALYPPEKKVRPAAQPSGGGRVFELTPRPESPPYVGGLEGAFGH